MFLGYNSLVSKWSALSAIAHTTVNLLPCVLAIHTYGWTQALMRPVLRIVTSVHVSDFNLVNYHSDLGFNACLHDCMSSACILAL